jgi:hypothetical protein
MLGSSLRLRGGEERETPEAAVAVGVTGRPRGIWAAKGGYGGAPTGIVSARSNAASHGSGLRASRLMSCIGSVTRVDHAPGGGTRWRTQMVTGRARGVGLVWFTYIIFQSHWWRGGWYRCGLTYCGHIDISRYIYIFIFSVNVSSLSRAGGAGWGVVGSAMLALPTLDKAAARLLV